MTWTGTKKTCYRNVERSALANVTAEQMEQHLSDPAAVQQLLDFLTQIQWKTTSVFSHRNAWKFSEELRELYPLRLYLYNEGDAVYIPGADKYEITDFNENAVSNQQQFVYIAKVDKATSRRDFGARQLSLEKVNPVVQSLLISSSDKLRVFT